jgi:hypothetical protein
MVAIRKLVLGMSVSAGGFVCGSNHETDWLVRNFICQLAEPMDKI